MALIQPKVSVIIPTYNCERYLAQAVTSVLNQQGTSYEVLVIDDGSTDSTQTVLEEFADRIIYIHQENLGVAKTRNRGIQEAKGELIAFLDADDYFLPDKLAGQVAIFEDRADLGIVHSGWRKVDAQGEDLLEVRPWQKIPELNLESWVKWKPVLPSAMMFRREWLEKVGGFDPQYPPAEDTELLFRLALHGCHADWLKRVTVCYRQHPESAMHKGLPQARSLSKAIDAFFQHPNLPESIQIIEKQVRYGTLVWIGWYLHRTGHYPETIDYLRKSWKYSSTSPIETVINWTESFAEFSRNEGEILDTDALTKLPEWQELVQWAIMNAKEMLYR
jgi:glycosyltransferase involved in cell wall biosynthesis